MLIVFLVTDELDVYLAAHCPDFSPASNNANANSNSVTGGTNTPTRQNTTANMNHSVQDNFDNGGNGPKRKMDGDPGDIGFLGNPSKVPKIEPQTPGSPQLLSAASPRVMSGSDNLNSTGIKTEVKSELEPDNIGAGRLMTSGSGGGNFSNSDETFLFDGGSSSTGVGNTGNISTEQPVDRLLLSKTAGQHNSGSGNSSAAAKIKNALEASGLSGNLTAEDLQTLKKLNEIAKSQQLSQEAKSSEASQLLKNNPNVSRLLLKLRTEKNISRGGGGPEQGQGVSGQYHGQFPGQHNMADRDGSPSVNAVLPPYNSNYAGGHPQQQQQQSGANNNNYQSPMGGGQQPGQWTGQSQDYYGHNPGHMPGQYPGYMGPMRGPSQMYAGGPPMGSMMDRVHSGMNMAPGAPRTMYIRDRTTGIMMQEYPGNMMRPGPGYGVPPPYMGPNAGYHHGPMMSRGRMMSPMISPGPGSPYNPRHAGPAPMYPDYDNNFAGSAPPTGAAVNFQRDFRDQSGGGMAGGMMSSNKFPGNDFPASVRGPAHTGVSQLRERLSRPGPGINNSPASGNMSGGSELANRLLHGKPQHEPPRYIEPNNSFNNGSNIKPESDSLFDEIDYFNSADNPNNTDQNQSSFGNYNYDNGGESSNGFNGQPQVGDTWKKSSGTNDVRQTMLRKLSTAIESNNMSVPEAFKLANEIENKAFAVANSEADYTSKIALHLAKIFSQSKAASAQSEVGDTCPDSTTWQDQTSGQPSNSSPDSSQSYKPESSSHFQSDTTLNCFQVRGGS